MTFLVILVEHLQESGSFDEPIIDGGGVQIFSGRCLLMEYWTNYYLNLFLLV